MTDYLVHWASGPGATEEAIAETEKQLGRKLPTDYVEFLKLKNGGPGFIGECHLILWSIEELASMILAYEAWRYAPGFLIFGSSGGGEAYGFDTRVPKLPVVQVPFVGMDWKLAEPVGDSFNDFIERLAAVPLAHTQESEPLFLASPCFGKEIFEIQPIILGGSPTDRANKVLLNREEHIKFVAFWNKTIANLRGNG